MKTNPNNSSFCIGNRVASGGAEAPFIQYFPDRLFHTEIIGKTGSGKSTLMENMILEDISGGFSVAVIDPKGDLITRILERIPAHRAPFVLHFNPADEKYIVPFNMLAPKEKMKNELILSNTLGALKAFWAHSWGSRLEYINKNCIRTLLECVRPQSLAGITRLLLDPGYREWVVDRASHHPKVHQFWHGHYSKWTKGQREEWTMPVINKMDFLSDAPLKNVMGQVTNTYSIRKGMDAGTIFLIDIPKGRIGEDEANLLGSLWASAFKAAAFTRIDTPEKQRTPFYLHIDEFQNFTTEDYFTAFPELRGMKVGLTVAHQSLDQLTLEARTAVLGNIGSLISFRVSGKDAGVLETEFDGEVSPDLLTGLDNFQGYVKPMVKGESQIPFRTKMHPPKFRRTNQEGIIINRSRKQFGRPADEVTETLNRWYKNHG